MNGAVGLCVALRREARWAAGLLLAAAVAAAQTPQSPQEAAAAAAAANLQLGITYMRQRPPNLALAKEKLEKAYKQAPRDPNVNSALALLQEQLGNHREAENYHRAALRLAPQRPELQNNFAVFLCRTGKHAEGLRRFEEVADNKLYKTPHAALTNAGVCARDAKQFDKAVEYFKRALQLMPNHAEAVVQYAGLQLSRGFAAEARGIVDGYLQAFIPQPDVLLMCVYVARVQADRLAEERCARRLRTDFANSAATRELQKLPARGK
ncbi:MAG: type IV pilus biogenesis/stability protein PilW [Steroidobacteraceae bacterium]|nr:type IV pilus biogenesis/stability protein PilW [Steroidobacteraceae bacterium]MDW8260482.1 type IV pilus biogenesis/stability protein PilW [Gammaproteobacteria bacterium]